MRLWLAFAMLSLLGSVGCAALEEPVSTTHGGASASSRLVAPATAADTSVAAAPVVDGVVNLAGTSVWATPQVEGSRSQSVSLLLNNTGTVSLGGVSVRVDADVSGSRRVFEVNFPEIPVGYFGWNSIPFPVGIDGQAAVIADARVDLAHAVSLPPDGDELVSAADIRRDSWDIDVLVRPTGEAGLLVVSVMYFAPDGEFISSSHHVRTMPAESDPDEEKVRVALPSVAGDAARLRVALARGVPSVTLDGVPQP